MAVRFPVFPNELSDGFPAYSRTPRLWSQPMRPVGFRNGEGDVNHERISVPEVRALSQQLRTSFNHYESAWRTANTGLNPVSGFEPVLHRWVSDNFAIRLVRNCFRVT